MELTYGRLPDGTTYICKGPLLERRAPQVSIGKDTTYGMGLMVYITSGIPTPEIALLFSKLHILWEKWGMRHKSEQGGIREFNCLIRDLLQE